MDEERDRCVDELDATFVACEEAYARARERRPAAGLLTSSLLIAAATSGLALDLLGRDDAGRRLPIVLRLAAEACEQCAAECERDGASWLLPARDACRSAAGACRALEPKLVGNGPH